MRKFLHKAKAMLDDSSAHDAPSQADEPSTLCPPTPDDVIRFRYHHGTNLGSIFVLERWLSGSMFPESASGGSELDAVTATVRDHGLDAARQQWEQHWQHALTDADLEWLVHEARCTSIRLPIGYFTLGPSYCRGTPFEAVAGVYDNAWQHVRALIDRAYSYGIGTLIDFHALPGGGNGEEHSGTSSKTAAFWGNQQHLQLAYDCVTFLATEIRSIRGVVGLQLVNEAVWDAHGMYDWYDRAINGIAQIDGTIPIYISDGWDLGRALSWTNSRHALTRGGPPNPIIVDTHNYYTFSDADRSKTPHEIIAQIPSELSALHGKDGALAEHGEAQVVIGEYSCVLDGQTWSRVAPEDKEGLVRQFGHAQSAKWQQVTGGCYFWTLKMDWMDGGEWGFVEQTKKGHLPPPPNLLLGADDVGARVRHAHGQRSDLAAAAREGHERYWNDSAPGQDFEHHRYADGWEVGFSDAQCFFEMRSLGRLGGSGADKIGCLDAWTKKRMLESGQRGKYVWEWEHGFRGGITAFYAAVGV